MFLYKTTCFVCLLFTMQLACSQDKLYPNEFPLEAVQLLDGPFKNARDLNITVLLKYDVDRLMAGYYKEAGLPSKASIYSNWDGLDGHVGGHYLSALAMNYASTRNAACKKRMDHMVAALKACQQAHTINHPEWAVGYAGAVPNGTKIWSSLKKGDFTAYNAAWVPWYNVHKTYAGLRDAWMYAGSKEAKNIFLKFCDWAINITASLSDEQMQTMLDMEHGGMNETFADAYQISGDNKYLSAAKRFSHKALLNPMARENDNLDNKHANTQVPKVIGFERIGELDNNEVYKRAGNFFWETVTGNRSLAFGGNSRREFFPSVKGSTDFVQDAEGPESCNSYNMLKLTENLFRVTPRAKYADYYERTIYNHMLSTQHPGHGGYVYFTPARPRHYRVYSSPNQAMWCCVGSGMENHGKYNQFIYTHSGDSLYLNLFIASSLNWKEKKIKLKQLTQFPYQEKTAITITEGAAAFTMLIRYPSWVKAGAFKVTVNGKNVGFTNHPSSYVAVKRLWKKGDVVTLTLPMLTRIEQLPNVPGYLAFLYGPIVLGAKTGTEDLKGLVADDSRWGQIAGGKKLPLNTAPILIEDNLAALSEKLKPVNGKPLHFSMKSVKTVNPIEVELEPFYGIHDSRYMLYWMTLSRAGYQSYLDSVAAEEKAKLELEKRTIDFIAPGEQQPEADHFIQKENSNTGNEQDEFWRDANKEGYFSYLLSTKNETNLSLLVKYWGAEWGNRKFDIYIDDEKWITEDNTGRWNQSAFHTVAYDIPVDMIKGKQNFRVKFKALPGNSAGAVYFIRLVKK